MTVSARPGSRSALTCRIRNPLRVQISSRRGNSARPVRYVSRTSTTMVTAPGTKRAVRTTPANRPGQRHDHSITRPWEWLAEGRPETSSLSWGEWRFGPCGDRSARIARTLHGVHGVT